MARFMQTLLVAIYCGVSLAEVKTSPDISIPDTCTGQDGDSCKALYGSDSDPDHTNLMQTHVHKKHRKGQRSDHKVKSRSPENPKKVVLLGAEGSKHHGMLAFFDKFLTGMGYQNCIHGKCAGFNGKKTLNGLQQGDIDKALVTRTIESNTDYYQKPLATALPAALLASPPVLPNDHITFQVAYPGVGREIGRTGSHSIPGCEKMNAVLLNISTDSSAEETFEKARAISLLWQQGTDVLCGLPVDIPSFLEEHPDAVVVWMSRSLERLVASHTFYNGGLFYHLITCVAVEMYMGDMWKKYKSSNQYKLLKADTDFLDTDAGRAEWIPSISGTLSMSTDCKTCWDSWKISHKKASDEMSAETYSLVLKVKSLLDDYQM